MHGQSSKQGPSNEVAQWFFFRRKPGGILGDAPGYGKTATTIGLIDSSFAVPPPAIPVDQAPYFFRASATLDPCQRTHRFPVMTRPLNECFAAIVFEGIMLGGTQGMSSKHFLTH